VTYRVSLRMRRLLPLASLRVVGFQRILLDVQFAPILVKKKRNRKRQKNIDMRKTDEKERNGTDSNNEICAAIFYITLIEDEINE